MFRFSPDSPNGGLLPPMGFDLLDKWAIAAILIEKCGFNFCPAVVGMLDDDTRGTHSSPNFGNLDGMAFDGSGAFTQDFNFQPYRVILLDPTLCHCRDLSGRPSSLPTFQTTSLLR